MGTSTPQPLIRASTMKYTVQTARASKDGFRALELVDAEVLRDIGDAARTTWLPAQYIITLNSALMEVGGDDLVIDVQRKLTLQTINFPLFRPVIRGAMRMFRGKPGAILKAVPHSLKLTTQSWGEYTMSVDDEARRATLVFSGLARELRHRSWMMAMTGGMLGSVDLAEARGEVTTESSALDGGTVQFDIEWFDD